MRDNFLKEKYFQWLCRIITEPEHKTEDYRYLLGYLSSRDFEYTIALDGNREEDGINLRYRFRHEHGYSYRDIGTFLDDVPCSILEMMIALAVRCEESLMENLDYGNRTSFWFWGMIKSLGLENMSDENFSGLYVESIIDRFLRRRYSKNGDGGLFTTKDRRFDMRTTEIWYQMNKYLNEL